MQATQANEHVLEWKQIGKYESKREQYQKEQLFLLGVIISAHIEVQFALHTVLSVARHSNIAATVK